MAGTIAVAWLLEEDWPTWREMDSQLPDFQQWLEKIEGAEKKLASEGTQTARVVVRPDKFIEWCRENGKAIARAPARNMQQCC
jgi:hypothetical protein